MTEIERTAMIEAIEAAQRGVTFKDGPNRTEVYRDGTHIGSIFVSTEFHWGNTVSDEAFSKFDAALEDLACATARI